MAQIRLALGTPAYGGNVCAEHMRMWMEIGHALANSSERFQLVMAGYVDINGIDNARNQLVKNAREAKCDWIFMVDADTWIEAIDNGGEVVDAGFQALRMISEADRAGAAIVAVPVALRQMREGRAVPAVYRHLVIGDGSHKPIDFAELADTRHLVQVDAVGAAAMAINLNLTQHAFAFTDLSEDLEFCRRVRGDGQRIFVDPRVRAGHRSRSFAIYL